MIVAAGHFCLWLALILALTQAIFPLYGSFRGKPALVELARPLAWMLSLSLLSAFFVLGYAFWRNDFSVVYVAEHSNLALPWYYRLVAIWGGHEGSLLLWTTIIGLWGAAVALLSRAIPAEVVARVLATLGMITIGFLLFMLMTSNPFDRYTVGIPLDGADLNPLLQDPGLIIHPPMLYMGYVGFSVAFAFAVAGLLGGKLDPAWARWARPWTTVAWCFLTCGIALGSWWAYYELGWGGWWFWDPVENASLMPWLVGTALMHSLAVTDKRGLLRAWTVLLSLIAFLLSLLGTFLVRSGVLTSVHAFANDPARGAFVLGFLSIVLVLSLGLFALRANSLRSQAGFAPLSREGLLLGNNLLLVVAAFIVVLGTLAPLVFEAMHMRISIRAPYFNLFIVPLVLLLLVLMVPGVLSRWKQQQAAPLWQQLWPSLLLAVFGGGLASWWLGDMGVQGSLALVLALWVVLAQLHDGARRALAFQQGLGSGLARLSRSYKGMVVAHCGLALVVAGVAIVSEHSIERNVSMAPGSSVTVGNYRFDLTAFGNRQGPNYQAFQGDFQVSHDGKPVAQLTSEKRNYVGGGQSTTEAGIDASLWRDLYVALGEPLHDADNHWAVRVYYRPAVRWLWLGALIMALGGAWALLDKRYRKPTRKETA